MLTLTAAPLESDVEAAPGARLGSCWEVETVPEVTRELHGRPSARRPPLVPCHSAQGPVPGKDAGDGDRHCQELPASGFPTALSGARSSWMRLSGEENPQQVHVRLGGGVCLQPDTRSGWEGDMGVALGCPRPCPRWVCTSALCQLGAACTPWAAVGGTWGERSPMPPGQ